MISHVDEDGRWRHKFRQSWLKTTDTCLERARLEALELMPDVESDAASVGTAVHAAIEVNIASGGLTLKDTLEQFNNAFSTQMAHPAFRWIKYDEASARKFGEFCSTSWFYDVMPTLDFDAVLEYTFEVPLHEDDQRVITVGGTADYWNLPDIKDWKTSGGGKYREWEYQRWAIQPTVYTYAAWVEGIARPTFEFVVMHKSGVQRFSVERDERHWGWLKTKALDMAKLIELDLSTWPRNDNHALCSEKWCPAWSQCKGATGITF